MTKIFILRIEAGRRKKIKEGITMGETNNLVRVRIKGKL
jgi:hypothetical protein